MFPLLSTRSEPPISEKTDEESGGVAVGVGVGVNPVGVAVATVEVAVGEFVGVGPTSKGKVAVGVTVIVGVGVTVIVGVAVVGNSSGTSTENPQRIVISSEGTELAEIAKTTKSPSVMATWAFD